MVGNDVLKGVLKESNAEFVKANIWTLGSKDNSFVRRFQIDRSQAQEAEEFLRTYLSASNYPNKFRQINNPVASTIRAGVYRGGRVMAMVEIDPQTSAETWYVYQELREGLATTTLDATDAVDFSGWRKQSGESFRSDSNTVILELPNVDPSMEDAIIAELTDDTFSTVSLADESLSGTWHNIKATSTLQEDGSHTILLFLSKHNNTDLYFKVQDTPTTICGWYYKWEATETTLAELIQTKQFDGDGAVVTSGGHTLQEEVAGRLVKVNRTTRDPEDRLFDVEIEIVWAQESFYKDTTTAVAVPDPELMKRTGTGTVLVKRYGTKGLEIKDEIGTETDALPEFDFEDSDTVNGTFRKTIKLLGITTPTPERTPAGKWNWRLNTETVTAPLGWILHRIGNEPKKVVVPKTISWQPERRLIGGDLAFNEDGKGNLTGIPWNEEWSVPDASAFTPSDAEGAVPVVEHLWVRSGLYYICALASSDYKLFSNTTYFHKVNAGTTMEGVPHGMGSEIPTLDTRYIYNDGSGDVCYIGKGTSSNPQELTDTDHFTAVTVQVSSNGLGIPVTGHVWYCPACTLTWDGVAHSFDAGYYLCIGTESVPSEIPRYPDTLWQPLTCGGTGNEIDTSGNVYKYGTTFYIGTADTGLVHPLTNTGYFTAAVPSDCGWQVPVAGERWSSNGNYYLAIKDDASSRSFTNTYYFKQEIPNTNDGIYPSAIPPSTWVSGGNYARYGAWKPYWKRGYTMGPGSIRTNPVGATICRGKLNAYDRYQIGDVVWNPDRDGAGIGGFQVLSGATTAWAQNIGTQYGHQFHDVGLYSDYWSLYDKRSDYEPNSVGDVQVSGGKVYTCTNNIFSSYVPPGAAPTLSIVAAEYNTSGSQWAYFTAPVGGTQCWAEGAINSAALTWAPFESSLVVSKIAKAGVGEEPFEEADLYIPILQQVEEEVSWDLDWEWTAKAYDSGEVIFHIPTGLVYKANAAIISTDVPGVSSKWDVTAADNPTDWDASELNARYGAWRYGWTKAYATGAGSIKTNLLGATICRGKPNAYDRYQIGDVVWNSDRDGTGLGGFEIASSATPWAYDVGEPYQANYGGTCVSDYWDQFNANLNYDVRMSGGKVYTCINPLFSSFIPPGATPTLAVIDAEYETVNSIWTYSRAAVGGSQCWSEGAIATAITWAHFDSALVVSKIGVKGLGAYPFEQFEKVGVITGEGIKSLSSSARVTYATTPYNNPALFEAGQRLVWWERTFVMRTYFALDPMWVQNKRIPQAIFPPSDTIYTPSTDGDISVYGRTYLQTTTGRYFKCITSDDGDGAFTDTTCFAEVFYFGNALFHPNDVNVSAEFNTIQVGDLFAIEAVIFCKTEPQPDTTTQSSFESDDENAVTFDKAGNAQMTGKLRQTFQKVNENGYWGLYDEIIATGKKPGAFKDAVG